MDRMIYLAMSGAGQAMDAMTTVAHNLANSSTTGFRADLNAFRSLPVQGEGQTTRSPYRNGFRILLELLL